MAEFATLEDVRAHLNVTSGTSDDELLFMLDAANDVVRSLVGSFAAETVTERVAVHGGTVILSRRPTGTVVVGGVAASDDNVDRAAGLVHGVWPAYGSAAVSYPVGTGQVPAAVSLATLIITGHLWETQRGTSPGQLPLQEQTVYDDTTFPSRGFAIPNRAKELLEPFLARSTQLA